MTLRNTLIQAVRTWAKAALSLTDEQIVPVMRGSNDKFMRLPLPYLTVNLTSFDTENGVDWKGFTATGSEFRGNRYTTVRLMGYGEGSDDWLIELGMRTGEYPEDYGSLISLGSSVIDASIPIGTHIEHQYSREFRLDYRLSLALTGTDNPATYADTFTVDVYNSDELVNQHLEV
jgi:hypothetical protein